MVKRRDTIFNSGTFGRSWSSCPRFAHSLAKVSAAARRCDWVVLVMLMVAALMLSAVSPLCDCCLVDYRLHCAALARIMC